MSKSTFLLISTLAAAAALSGCAGHGKREAVVQCAFPKQDAPDAGSALVAQEYGSISAIPLDAVQFTDGLKKQVAVQLLFAARTPTSTVQVTARLVNCTDKPLVIGARTNFMDKNEVPTEPQSVWQNVVLQPRALGIYQTSSMARGAEHYVIELRNAGN